MAPFRKPENFQLKIILNVILATVLSVALIIDFFKILPLPQSVFIALSIIGLLPVLQSAIKALINQELTIDLLASIALIFSFLAKQWYSAAFINLMLASARIFDLWTEARAKNIIGHLMKYRPVKVKIKKGERIIEKSAGQVEINDEVVIESGERIPIDGIVISGQASINEATLTGESMPVVKKSGDGVFTSTLNESGSLIVRTTKIGANTTLEKLIVLVEEASRKKAKTERMAVKFTQWYILLALGGSIIIYYFSHNLLLVLSVLLVVCADDIAVSVPLGFTAGIARAAQLGIIIKGSEVMEVLPKIKIFISDKTGTLTYGKLKIKEVRVFSKISETEFLKLLGMAEIESGHPIGKAIVNYLKENKIPVVSPDEVNEIPGEGIAVVKDNNKIFAGKTEFLKKNKVAIKERELKEIEEAENRGFNVTCLGINNSFAGFVTAEDEIRSFAKLLGKTLKELGVKKWIMLTGDNKRVASRVAKELEIDEYESNLTPRQKLNYIEEFKGKTENTLAMIGDGVNDAASLALADVSIAMGAIGSDTAIEAADVALMKDDLKRVPDMILLAKRVKKIAKQNFLIWGVTNAAGLFLVAAGFIGPVGASTYNFLTDFFPILNALRIGFFSPKKFQKGCA